MLELIVTVVITLSSVLMFGYWFRYTCLLIVSATTSRDYAMDVASANQLSFLQVQTQLRENPSNLDQLKASLDRDLSVLTTLIQNASGQGMEDRMLQLNYKVMGAWCSIAQSFSLRLRLAVRWMRCR